MMLSALVRDSINEESPLLSLVTVQWELSKLDSQISNNIPGGNRIVVRLRHCEHGRIQAHRRCAFPHRRDLSADSWAERYLHPRSRPIASLRRF